MRSCPDGLPRSRQMRTMILELLESRLHLSVSVADGVAAVSGTSGDDVIKLRAAGDLASTTLWIVVNGARETIARYPFDELPTRVVVESAGGRDTVIVELRIITATIEAVVK